MFPPNWENYNSELTHQANSDFSPRAWQDWLRRGDYDVVDWATIITQSAVSWRGAGIPALPGYAPQTGLADTYALDDNLGATDAGHTVISRAQLIYFNNPGTVGTVEYRLYAGTSPEVDKWLAAGWPSAGVMYIAGVQQNGGDAFRVTTEAANKDVYLFPWGTEIYTSDSTNFVYTMLQKGNFVFNKKSTAGVFTENCYLSLWNGEYYYAKHFMASSLQRCVLFVVGPNDSVYFVDDIAIDNFNPIFINNAIFSGVFAAFDRGKIMSPSIQFYGKRFIPKQASQFNSGDYDPQTGFIGVYTGTPP